MYKKHLTHKRHKNHDKLLAIAFLALACVIGYGAWLDTHSVATLPASQDMINRMYLAENDAALDALPDDRRVVLIRLGDFITKDGRTEYVSSAITPITLPQREADLLISLDNIPAPQDDMLDAMEAAIKKWKARNNTTIAIFLDYRQKQPDLDALGELSSALHLRFRRGYWVNLYLQRGWLDGNPEARTKISNIGKYARVYVFDAAEAQKPGETLAQTILHLNQFKFPFSLRVKAMPDAGALSRELGDKAPNFAGLIIEPLKENHHDVETRG